MSQKKKNIALIFGGKSGEHEVSISSALSVYKALDKDKYDVLLIGIDKTGRWLAPSEAEVLAHSDNPRLLKLNSEKESLSLIPFESNKQIVPLQNTQGQANQLSHHKIDVIIPILHGTFGEDGTIQGLLELSNIPYVGSGVLGSAVGMDKDVSRRLLKAAGIPTVPTLTFKKHEFTKDPQKVIDQALKVLGLPFFVKPANMGSSVGVYKVKTAADAATQIQNAFQYDGKILIEKSIPARELECSVLGNDFPRASIVGEIIPQHEFYSYEAKYIDENGALLKIPAEDISADLVLQIQNYSTQAFQVLECSGLARVDFFLDRHTGELFLNEINTLPGFTKISMYPKLWEASGLGYAQLLDELIQLAIEKHKMKNELKTSFEP